MSKTLIILSLTVLVFTSLAISYNMNSTNSSKEDEQRSLDRYFEMDNTMNNLLDTCERNGKMLHDEVCVKAANAILNGCNGLQTKPPACDDERIYDILQGDANISDETNLELENTIKQIIKMCEKNGETVKIDECIIASKTVLETCAELKATTPLCSDTRLYTILE